MASPNGFRGWMIDYGSSVYTLPSGNSILEGDQNRHSFLAFLGGPVAGFDTDRDVFVGPYNGYRTPRIVEKGQCSGSLAYGDDGCGTIQIDVELEPGQSQEFVVLMGIGKAAVEGKKVVKQFGDISKVKEEFEKVRQYWHNRIEGMAIQTPDAAFNSMMNM
jgi:cellobiose phosphorylase